MTALNLFCLFERECISEEFISLCRGVTSSLQEPTQAAFLKFRQFGAIKQTLLTLGLLEKGYNHGQSFFTVPRVVKEFILGEEAGEYQHVARTAVELLLAGVKTQEKKILSKSLAVISPHALCLGKLVHGKGLEGLRELGLVSLEQLVSLYHLRETASKGFNRTLKRSVRTWTAHNRVLEGEDRYEPSDYDSFVEIPQIPARILSSSPTLTANKARLIKPVASVLTENISKLSILGTIARAWFTVKEEMLEVARRAARVSGSDNDTDEDDKLRDRVADLVDKGAHDAITHAAVKTSKEYSVKATLSGTEASEILDDICTVIAHNFGDTSILLAYNENELTDLVSASLGYNFTSLVNVLGRAMASVLENCKEGIAVMVDSLVSETVDPSGLPSTISAAIVEICQQQINRFVYETSDAVWEATGVATMWLGVMISVEISVDAIRKGNENTLNTHVLISNCIESLFDAAEAVGSGQRRNWEWAALVRDTMVGCAAAGEARLYSGLSEEDNRNYWEERWRKVVPDDDGNDGILRLFAIS
jgi:hypothetical protein